MVMPPPRGAMIDKYPNAQITLKASGTLRNAAHRARERLARPKSVRLRVFTTDKTRTMKGSFGGVTSGSIVLGPLPEKNKPSYTTIRCSNLLIWPSTAKLAWIRAKMAFSTSSAEQKELDRPIFESRARFDYCT